MFVFKGVNINKMNGKMLCLFLDAFRPEYLRYTENINALAKKSLYGELEVPLGFTSILASFFTGCYPDKHGLIDVFDRIEAGEKGIWNIKNKFLLNFFRLLENKRFFYTPLKIKERKYFKPCLEKAWPQRNCLKIPTLFDILEKNNVSFTSIDWPNYYVGEGGKRIGKIFLDSSAEKVFELTKKAKTKFIFVHFLDLEKVHKFGVDSKETLEILKKIDKIVGELFEKSEDLIIFSDHGMDDIEGSFDLKSKLDNLDLKFGKDYIYFIGSTITRFWFNNEKAEKKVKELLENLKFGKIVDFKKYHLPKMSKTHKTCDLIFLADFKKIFYPNFFGKKYKAMHGWDPKIQKAFYLIKSKGVKKKKENTHIVNLLPQILKMLKINDKRK